MALNKILTRRSAVAVAAGTALVFGAAACSDAEDTANNATSAANDATDAAGSAANDATDAAGSAANNASEAMSSDDNSEGDSQDLPADIQTLWDNEGGESGDLGALKNVEKTDKGTLATFDNGWVTHSDETGAVKLVGKIGETWANDGALDNEIGLPTAPEQGDAMNGWTQSFQNGTISWTKDDNGEFEADVEDN